jgi:signal-transduction protein with cAMP-binding, CBS, and nucleotidyltransferase domain
MQTAVSTRLQHILFAPEEIIYQPAGKERLYIIRMGKIDVFA